MKLLSTAKKNPKTTVLTVITIVSNLWNVATENAELFGIGSKTIAIGSLVLTALVMIYNAVSADSTEE